MSDECHGNNHRTWNEEFTVDDLTPTNEQPAHVTENENIEQELTERDKENALAYMFEPRLRTFETGATRDLSEHKLDYEGFLSPIVLRRFAEYMHKHRKQKDGTVRSSDNWQKGIPKDEYMKSAFRHFMEVWELHRGFEKVLDSDGNPINLEEALCALFFNIQGYLYELIKEKEK